MKMEITNEIIFGRLHPFFLYILRRHNNLHWLMILAIKQGTHEHGKFFC